MINQVPNIEGYIAIQELMMLQTFEAKMQCSKIWLDHRPSLC
jgi:hypothetical protein